MSLLGSNEIKTENVRCRNIKDAQISDLYEGELKFNNTSIGF